ncbi:unnamed protein product, partial [Protopolystoma xenopodis]
MPTFAVRPRNYCYILVRFTGNSICIVCGLLSLFQPKHALDLPSSRLIFPSPAFRQATLCLVGLIFSLACPPRPVGQIASEATQVGRSVGSCTRLNLDPDADRDLDPDPNPDADRELDRDLDSDLALGRRGSGGMRPEESVRRLGCQADQVGPDK